MKIKTQKIITFIPLINFPIMITYWLMLYLTDKIPLSRFPKNLLKVFMWFFIISIPIAILHINIASDFINQLLSYVNVYLIGVVVSLIAIKDQQKYFGSK